MLCIAGLLLCGIKQHIKVSVSNGKMAYRNKCLWICVDVMSIYDMNNRYNVKSKGPKNCVLVPYCDWSDTEITTYISAQHIEAETKWPPFSGRHFQIHFRKENVWMSIQMSLKFLPKVPINNIPALFQIMAWSLPGVKPLFGTMTVRLATHVCVSRPQCVKMKIKSILLCGFSQALSTTLISLRNGPLVRYVKVRVRMRRECRERFPRRRG